MDSIVAVRPARDHLMYQQTISGKIDQGSGELRPEKVDHRRRRSRLSVERLHHTITPKTTYRTHKTLTSSD